MSEARPTYKLDEMSNPEHRVNFWGRAIRYQSLIALKLELLCNNTIILEGTGFIARLPEDGELPVLVTNWHLLAGRDHNSGQPLHSSGGIPDHIRVHFHLAECNLGNSTEVTRAICTFPLYTNADANWICHELGQDVDVAAIKLNGVSDRVQLFPLNYASPNASDITPSQEVFTIGFPQGISTVGNLPVWKRGTIASEPLIFNDQISNGILLDSTTRAGMSGSPSFVNRGTSFSVDGTKNIKGVYHANIVPLGIYSSRYVSSDKFASEIGRIWPLGFIDGVLETKCPGGEFELRKID